MFYDVTMCVMDPGYWESVTSDASQSERNGKKWQQSGVVLSSDESSLMSSRAVS